jgi:hypothetical protein
VKLQRSIFSGFVFVACSALLAGIPVVVAMLRYRGHEYSFEFHWQVWQALFIAVTLFSLGFFFQYWRDLRLSPKG